MAERRNFRRNDGQRQSRYEQDYQRTPWHLDKTFSLGMLGTLIALTVSGITAAVKLSDRVDHTVEDITAVQAEIKEEATARQAEIQETDKARTEMSAHFASIDVTLQDMKSMMFQSSQRAMQLVMPSTAPSGSSQQPIILQQAAPNPEGRPDDRR